jgi:Zn-dependent protease
VPSFVVGEAPRRSTSSLDQFDVAAGSWLRLRGWKAFGADIYVHQYVLIASAALVVLAIKNSVLAITCLASYVAIIFAHEFGHAAIARHLGYEVTAIRVGLLHGRCEYEHPDSAWEASLVSWGGVLAQFLIAALVFAVAGVISGSLSDYFGPIVIFLGYMNMVIAAMNLTPRAPFDGDLAWRIFPTILDKVRGEIVVRRAIKRASKRR